SNRRINRFPSTSSIGGTPSRTASLRFLRECSCCQDNGFISSALHRPSKISDLAGTHRTCVSLALKEHFECHELIDLYGPYAVNSAIATAACDLHMFEIALSEQALAQPFETRRRQSLKD